MNLSSDVIWLTVDDVAERLQVNPETVRRWIRSGDLDVLEIGGRKGGYRIHPDALDKFVSERYGKSTKTDEQP